MTGSRYSQTRVRQVEAFLERNKGEFYTLKDMASLFDCTETQAKNALNQLQKAGRVTCAIHYFLNPERHRNAPR